MELVAVIIANDGGIDDNGRLTVSGGVLDWLEHAPEENDRSYVVTLLARNSDLEEQRTAQFVIASPGGRAAVVDIPLPAVALPSLNLFFLVPMPATVLASVLGRTRLDVALVGSDEESVWTEYTVR